MLFTYKLCVRIFGDGSECEYKFNENAFPQHPCMYCLAMNCHYDGDIYIYLDGILKLCLSKTTKQYYFYYQTIT